MTRTKTEPTQVCRAVYANGVEQKGHALLGVAYHDCTYKAEKIGLEPLTIAVTQAASIITFRSEVYEEEIIAVFLLEQKP